MSQVGYRDIQQVLQFLRNAKILHDLFRLIAEMSVDAQSFFCVDLGHLKIVLCGRR